MMTLEDLYTLLDKTCKLAANLKDDDAGGYAKLSGLVKQLAFCIDDGTITEDQHGFQTVVYLVNHLIETNFIEF